MSVSVQAAEQIFDVEGGYSSLVWLDHPTRPLIFLIHHSGYWQGWPDTWDGLPVLPLNGARRGFGFYLRQRQEAGWNVDVSIGQAIRQEQAYTATVRESESGWKLTDSYGRLLYLDAKGMTWSVERWP